ncbi:MAG: hypothetical protein HYV93_04705 [Candidatus Rokubacteria bacterium]|nr:hypothetical protein [Candidatus Rokubacteria bacterium]
MADLKPQIERLLGTLSRAGRPAGQAPTQVEAPPPVLRAGDPGFAAAVARLVGMPLDQYARDGAPLEVRVPWHGETVWFVPDDRQAEALVRDDVSRGRIWTAEELLHVMPVANRGMVPTISIAKLTMDGHLVEVSARDRGDPDGRGRRQRLP